jgi:hypothetical protein
MVLSSISTLPYLSPKGRGEPSAGPDSTEIHRTLDATAPDLSEIDSQAATTIMMAAVRIDSSKP